MPKRKGKMPKSTITLEPEFVTDNDGKVTGIRYQIPKGAFVNPKQLLSSMDIPVLQ